MPVGIWNLFFEISNDMDLQEQLKKLFPNHEVSHEPEEALEENHELYIQKEPMICKYEKIQIVLFF